MIGPSIHFVEFAESDQASRRNNDRENAARPAVVEVQQVSTGLGQYRLPHPVIFPVNFRTEPHFVCGSAVILGPNTSLYHDPRGSSGVWAWKRDANGLYIGAFCWLRVDCEKQEAGDTLAPGEFARAKKERQFQALKAAKAATDLRKVRVMHYMTFSAVGVKIVPGNTMSANPQPRPIGL